jgi:hypothetical protein
MILYISPTLASTLTRENVSLKDKCLSSRVAHGQPIFPVTGLPREWQDMLQASGVSRQEQEKNPEAVSCLRQGDKIMR